MSEYITCITVHNCDTICRDAITRLEKSPSRNCLTTLTHTFQNHPETSRNLSTSLWNRCTALQVCGDKGKWLFKLYTNESFGENSFDYESLGDNIDWHVHSGTFILSVDVM